MAHRRTFVIICELMELYITCTIILFGNLRLKLLKRVK